MASCTVLVSICVLLLLIVLLPSNAVKTKSLQTAKPIICLRSTLVTELLADLSDNGQLDCLITKPPAPSEEPSASTDGLTTVAHTTDASNLTTDTKSSNDTSSDTSTIAAEPVQKASSQTSWASNCGFEMTGQAKEEWVRLLSLKYHIDLPREPDLRADLCQTVQLLIARAKGTSTVTSQDIERLHCPGANQLDAICAVNSKLEPAPMNSSSWLVLMSADMLALNNSNSFSHESLQVSLQSSRVPVYQNWYYFTVPSPATHDNSSSLTENESASVGSDHEHPLNANGTSEGNNVSELEHKLKSEDNDNLDL
eukprot:GILK01011833.1.p1 GENE.GILK01011833.1~~GILK01011833.1.p1  ORF type:complete len:320 (+),score=31.66 GILK01011833.1:30-962(+)